MDKTEEYARCRAVVAALNVAAAALQEAERQAGGSKILNAGALERAQKAIEKLQEKPLDGAARMPGKP